MTAPAPLPAGTAPPDLPPLGEVLEFLRVIWAVHHGLERTSKDMEARLGVTGPQRLVLRIVGRFPGIGAGPLARTLHVHPSTLTGVLKRLERRGLLDRRPDPRDGRRISLGLTTRGRRVDLATTGTVEAAVKRTLSGVPRSKLRATEAVLRALARSLEQEVASP